jgi:hypothetical protein
VGRFKYDQVSELSLFFFRLDFTDHSDWPASGEVTAYKSCIRAQLKHKKEPLNPEFPGENQQETLHLTLIMALVLGSGFMRKTMQLFPYFNYYYQKAAVPM